MLHSAYWRIIRTWVSDSLRRLLFTGLNYLAFLPGSWMLCRNHRPSFFWSHPRLCRGSELGSKPRFRSPMIICARGGVRGSEALAPVQLPVCKQTFPATAAWKLERTCFMSSIQLSTQTLLPHFRWTIQTYLMATKLGKGFNGLRGWGHNFVVRTNTQCRLLQIGIKKLMVKPV